MSLLDVEKFLNPVEGQDDLLAFRYDFGLGLEGKATPDAVSFSTDSITTLEDGDLLIEGWAANFEGIDRQGENFAEGAFQRGIKSFLSSQASLNFHHKHDHGIGKVLQLDEVEGKGLHMKARVDYQPESSPFRYIYNGIKKGSYNGLSVGGFFKRGMTPDGPRIVDMDFTEISVTPVPIHRGTSFSVVAGKALVDITFPQAPDTITGEVRAADAERIRWALEELDTVFTQIGQRGSAT